MNSDNHTDLIQNIKDDIKVDQSLSILYDSYSCVYYKIIHSHFQGGQHEEKKTELLKECPYHIYFAAKEFDFNKNIKFSSYVGNKARWICLNFFNKEKMIERNLLVKGQSAETCLESSIKEIIKTETLQKIHDEIKKEEDLRVAKIFDMRYFEPRQNKTLSWRQISGELNMSIQGCINIHNRFIKKIKNKKII